MKSFILIVISIIAVIIIVGGVTALHIMNEAGMGVDDLDSNSINNLLWLKGISLNRNSIRTLNTNTESSDNSNSGDSSSDKSLMGDLGDIVNEKIKYNYQNGGGYYREVTYKDGGFRQYDTDSGKLIGSSYESDQSKLPRMEWLHDIKGFAESFWD